MDPPTSSRGIKRAQGEALPSISPKKRFRTSSPTEIPLSESASGHHVGPHIIKDTEDMSADELAVHEEAKRSHGELMELLRHELSGYLYESPSLLSSFCPDHGRTPAIVDWLLENHWIIMQDQKIKIKDWPPPCASKEEFYSPFQSLLDAIITAFRRIYPDLPSYWVSKNIKFHVHDEEMHKSVKANASIKPAILSTSGLRPYVGQLRSWSEVEIPGELGKDWNTIIAKAASYAGCMFASADYRYFAPVFSLNYQIAHFRLAVFHRGGLLASTIMDLSNHDGFYSFVSAIVGMLSWTNSTQSGYTTGHSASHFRLNNNLYRIERTICRRNIVRGRGTRVFLLSHEPNDESDNEVRKVDVKHPITSRTSESTTPRLKDLEALSASSLEPHSDGIQLPINSFPHRFVLKCSHPLASRDKEEDIFTSVKKYIGVVNIICGYDADQITLPDDTAPWNLDSTPPATRIEHRLHRHILIQDIGKPLSAARGPKELVLALLHAMSGHCALFYEGTYLHRDISNGNILLLSTEEERLIPPLLSGIVPTGQCTAVLIDGDVAKRWGDGAEASFQRVGTKPFVSQRVSSAWRRNQSIIHTPLDDLESFFWVLVYTILAQIPPSTRTEAEKLWWTWLNHDTLAEVISGKTDIVDCMDAPSRSSDFSKYWEVFNGLVSDWKDLSVRGQTQLRRMKQLDYEGVKESSKEAYIDFINAGFKHMAALPDDWPALEL